MNNNSNLKYKFNTPWNNKANLLINSFDTNINNTLLILATNNGYRVIDTNSFTLISYIDSFMDQIGDLYKAKTFFSSRYVYFVGNEANASFPPNQLIVWDDYMKRKENMIMIKENIHDFFFSKFILCVCVSNEILVFDNIKFNFIHKIEDIASNIHQIVTYGFNEDDTMIAKVGCSTMNIVNIYIYRRKKGKIYLKKENLHIDTFDCINAIHFDIYNHNDLIVISKFGNKIHIYSYDEKYSFKLKNCFYLGNCICNISNTFIYNDKYFFFMNSSENIQIYKLIKKINSTKTKIHIKCTCKEHSDEKQVVISKSKSSSSKSLIGGLIRKFTGVNEMYQNVIVNNGRGCVMFHHKKMKKTFVVINKNGKALLVRYGKKDKMNPKVIKEVTWLH